MLKTICLYGFILHIHSDIHFSVCKRGDNQNVLKCHSLSGFSSATLIGTLQ